MANQMQNSISAFLGGVLFAAFVWFLFYRRYTLLEGPGKVTGSSVAVLEEHEKNAQWDIVYGTPPKDVGIGEKIIRIPDSSAKRCECGIPLNGKKGNEEVCKQVNDTAMTKSRKVQVEASSGNLPATTSSTSAGTQDVDESSAAAVTNARPYKRVRQHLGKWGPIDEDPDHKKFEFIVLQRENPTSQIPRIKIVVAIQDDILKQFLMKCLPPEKAIFDE